MSLNKWQKEKRFKSLVGKIDAVRSKGLVDLDHQLFEKINQSSRQELQNQSKKAYQYLLKARWLFILISLLFGVINTLLTIINRQQELYWVLYAVIALWAIANMQYGKRDDFPRGIDRHLILGGDIVALLLIIHYSGGIYSFGGFMLPLLVFEPVLNGQLKIERWLVAIIMTGCYALLVLIEHFGLITPVIPPFIHLNHNHYFSYELLVITGIASLTAGITLIASYFADDLQQTKERLTDFVEVDLTTGIYNRQVFLEQLLYEITRCTPDTRVVSLLLLKIDTLTETNHQQGFQAGDKLLALVAETISNNIRLKARDKTNTFDIGCRISGATFGIILPELNPAYIQSSLRELKTHQHDRGMIFVANRLQEKLATALKEYPTSNFSIGIATWPMHGKEANSLLKQAEQALAEARNQEVRLKVADRVF